MRVTTVFNKLLQLTGAWVTGVNFTGDTVVVDVALTSTRELAFIPPLWSASGDTLAAHPYGDVRPARSA